MNKGDLALPDGIGLCYAAAALHDYPNLHRHTGVDVLQILVEICAEKGKSMVLVAGKPGGMDDLKRADKAATVLKQQHPSLNVYGIDPGLIDSSNPHLFPPETLLQIKMLEPAVLAIALPQRFQMRFLHELLPLFPSVRIGIGVGGACDMIAGILPRAPLWMRKTGLEWLWRVILEPRRINRIFRPTIVFPILIVTSTIQERIFLRACRSVFPLVWKQLFKK